MSLWLDEGDDLGAKAGRGGGLQRCHLMRAVDAQAFGVLPADAQDKAFAVHAHPVIGIGQAVNPSHLDVFGLFPGGHPGDDLVDLIHIVPSTSAAVFRCGR